MTLYTTTGARGYEEAYLLKPHYLQSYPVLGALVSIPVALTAGVLAIKQAVSSLFYRAATCPRQEFVNGAWQGREITLIRDAKELGSICLANIINVCTLGVFNLISANRARAQRQNAPIEPIINAAYVDIADADIADALHLSFLLEAQEAANRSVARLPTELQNWVVFFENSLTIEELTWVREETNIESVDSFIIGTIIITYAFGERKNYPLPQDFFNDLIYQFTTNGFIQEVRNFITPPNIQSVTTKQIYACLSCQKKRDSLSPYAESILGLALKEFSKKNLTLKQLVLKIKTHVRLWRPTSAEVNHWISVFKTLPPDVLNWIRGNENLENQRKFIIGKLIATYAFGERKGEEIPKGLFVSGIYFNGNFMTANNLIKHLRTKNDESSDITYITDQLCKHHTTPSEELYNLYTEGILAFALLESEKMSPELDFLVNAISEGIQNNNLRGHLLGQYA